MAEITSYSEDHWALSDDVRGKIHVKQKGDPIDVEEYIDSATDSVQAWWRGGTGLDYPDDLPDPATLQDDNALLADAVEYLAASQTHEAYSENVRAHEHEDRDERKFVFLEERAHEKFDDWITLYGYDEPDSGDPEGPGSVGTPTVGIGKIDSLADLPSEQGSLGSQYDSEDWYQDG